MIPFRRPVAARLSAPRPNCRKAGRWFSFHPLAMYAKIFAQIFDSSIVEKPETRFTFMDMLVLADPNGVVDMTHEAIARRTNRPLEVIRATITELESPDGRSRTPTDDGRRLKRLDAHRDWGWIITNYDTFRRISSEEQRREKTKERTRNWRAQRDLELCDAPVTHGDAGDAMQKQRQKQMQREKEEVLPSLPSEALRLRICGWFKRRPGSVWDKKELAGLAIVVAANTPEEDLLLLDRFYAAPDSYHRKDVQTLLNNWNGEIDKAKDYANRTQNNQRNPLRETGLERRQRLMGPSTYTYADRAAAEARRAAERAEALRVAQTANGQRPEQPG